MTQHTRSVYMTLTKTAEFLRRSETIDPVRVAFAERLQPRAELRTRRRRPAPHRTSAEAAAGNQRAADTMKSHCAPIRPCRTARSLQLRRCGSCRATAAP